MTRGSAGSIPVERPRIILGNINMNNDKTKCKIHNETLTYHDAGYFCFSCYKEEREEMKKHQAKLIDDEVEITHSLKTELHSLFRPEGVTYCDRKVSSFRRNEFYSRRMTKVNCPSCLKVYEEENKRICEKWIL